MYNDQDFYVQYADYLNEPQVNRIHKRFARMLAVDTKLVIDLGCGKSNEFFDLKFVETYIGIDQNTEDKIKLHNPNNRLLMTTKGDYRKKECLEKLRCYNPDTFVSLFSTEITADTKTNYEYYKMIFELFPTIKKGIVSGFYYWTKKSENPIMETGDVQSFQTLESIEDVLTSNFIEMRHIAHVPSKMFGQDVIEVWKLFERHEEVKNEDENELCY